MAAAPGWDRLDSFICSPFLSLPDLTFSNDVTQCVHHLGRLVTAAPLEVNAEGSQTWLIVEEGWFLKPKIWTGESDVVENGEFNWGSKIMEGVLAGDMRGRVGRAAVTGRERCVKCWREEGREGRWRLFMPLQIEWHRNRMMAIFKGICVATLLTLLTQGRDPPHCTHLGH